MDLTTRYLGLVLSNPVIVASCGLTNSVDGVRACADAGAGAVVLKSLFEEQIKADVKKLERDINRFSNRILPYQKGIQSRHWCI